MSEHSFVELERRLDLQVKRQELALKEVRAQLEQVRELIRRSPELPLGKAEGNKR